MTTTHRYVIEVETPDDTDLLDYSIPVSNAVDDAVFNIGETLWDAFTTQDSFTIYVDGIARYDYIYTPEQEA